MTRHLIRIVVIGCCIGGMVVLLLNLIIRYTIGEMAFEYFTELKEHLKQQDDVGTPG